MRVPLLGVSKNAEYLVRVQVQVPDILNKKTRITNTGSQLL